MDDGSQGTLRLKQISPISEMTGDQRTYHAYLLRLWRVNIGRATAWHASLEDSRTGERKGFADLQGLLAFLEEQTRDAPQGFSDQSPNRNSIL